MAKREGSSPNAAVHSAGRLVNGQMGRYTLNPSKCDKWKSCKEEGRGLQEHQTLKISVHIVPQMFQPDYYTMHTNYFSSVMFYTYPGQGVAVGVGSMMVDKAHHLGKEQEALQVIGNTNVEYQHQ